MPLPSEKLAQSFEVLQGLQSNGIVAIRSRLLTRVHRERLLKNGFIREVMKGWYIPTRPDERKGESTSWFASFWLFCAAYLNSRFGSQWYLSPEQSVLLRTGNKTVPLQLLMRAPKAQNIILNLIHETSLLEVKAVMPGKGNILQNEDGLNIYSLPVGLINCTESFYVNHKTDARAALAMIRDSSDILNPLLAGGHSTIAGRLAGAFRNIGRNRIADEILASMKAAGYDVRENDPFKEQSPMLISSRELSPYVNRIRLMWQTMRGQILEVFPKSPGLPKNKSAYLKQVAHAYALDAYNSLSIEGYKVSPELIERVRSGKWSPDLNDENRKQQDALAARGYWEAFQEVENSLKAILEGENSGAVINHNHTSWYRALFSPSIMAGLLKASDLAGYRNGPVFIRRSMHVPPGAEAVRDLMPAFFELLSEEKEAAVRVVLGHFIFVYIHPYFDGNGRIARFLMNTMMASGGYPWTIIPVEQRNRYMNALENASVKQNILPFAEFLASLLNKK